ncbi:hypothetical protein [Roseivirga sp.]|uniref:hypothetical protein n=1 Tax=Roseivirga sp. TaxID=1964215 RepID=UPI002B26A497|nr:hypothetical protein [Roseivirga sp.]
MSTQNEFSKYSLEELEKKKKHFKRLQIMMFALTALSAILLTIAALVKHNNQAYQLIPFLVIAGVVFPLLVFMPIRKKIQAEIESR